jgi:hypothetical protein
MAEHPSEVRRINWSECCGFTHIFRTFRMAINPGKLALALAGVVLTFLWGWVLDGIWSRAQRPAPGELDAYWQVLNLPEYRDASRAASLSRLQAVYATLPVSPPADLATKWRDDPSAVINKLQVDLKEQFAKTVQSAPAGKVPELARDYNRLYLEVENMRPRGIFTSFIAYETGVAKHAMEAAYSLNFTGGFKEVMNARRDVTDPAMIQRSGPVGVLGSLVLMLRGKQWLVTQHPLFSLLFCLGTLAIWAFFGGAICRVAALNFARDERISPKAAVSFACKKYLGFLTAPLLPVAMILVIGLLLFLGGLLIMSIPYLGELIGALTLPLGLVGGFVIALVAIGQLAGGSLFYPTIAVEGSDSFDAMSRSYSYVFSKPWRAILYGLLALVYGALCYLFVRFFTLIVLKSTRFFIGAGTDVWTSRPRAGYDASKLGVMWTNPTFDRLWAPPTPFGMAPNWEPLGAWLITLWVALVVALLIAFVISFYYCASTIIYFLLRREVDATDLEDVYLDEDEAEPAGAGAPYTPPAPGGVTTAPSTFSPPSNTSAAPPESPPPPPPPSSAAEPPPAV